MSLMKSWCETIPLRGVVATAAISGLLFLVACDEDSGTSAPINNESESSSSTDSLNSSSSSSEESSSGVEEVSSSSQDGSSSSSSAALNCSVLLEGETGWSWDVPKECRFNPNITYGTMTDSRDNKVYKTVKIGNQVWMAENLNYADSVKTPSLMGKNWCYANKAENCAVTGRLYTWAAAIDSVKLATDADNPQDCGFDKTCTLPAKVQGICPDGWHLPTKTEWETLFTAVGGQSTAGKILKYQTGWISNGNDTDGVGFSALPAGHMDDYGTCYDGDYAGFWSATEDNGGFAYGLVLLYYSDGIGSDEIAHLYYLDKYYGFSVRCLKD